jgi:hypothetical protein
MLAWNGDSILTKAFFFSAFVLALGLPCFADSFYVGSDTACFYSGSESSCTPSSGTTGIGLDTKGSPLLTYTPDSGFTAPEAGGTVELGDFYVSPAFAGGEGGTFVVDVSFTDPADGDQTFTATTYGALLFFAGGAEVTFSQPTMQEFDYTGGSFEVTLPSKPILIGEGDTVALDANITTLTATPEPASVATILGGLMLLGIAVVRSRMARCKQVL